MPTPRKYIVREINQFGVPTNPGQGEHSFNTQSDAERHAQKLTDAGRKNGSGEFVVYCAVKKFAPIRRYDVQEYPCR